MSPSHRPPPCTLSHGSPKRHKPNAPPPSLTSLSDPLAHLTSLPHSPPPPAERHICALETTLSSLPTRTLRVDSAYLRNTLRKTLPGCTIAELFLSPHYHSLSLRCTPPAAIHVVGSHPVAPSATVDLALRLPDGLLAEKDFLNHSYHDKRLVYLLYLARPLLASNTYRTALLHHPTPPTPSLALTPLAEPRLTLRLLPYTTIFPPFKLSPPRRNIRPRGETSLPDDTALATRGYNASILVDATLHATLLALRATAASHPAFPAAVAHLRAWASRHTLPSFPATALLRTLVVRLPPHAPVEHLLRAVLTALRDGRLANLQFEGVPIRDTLSRAVLRRFADTAAVALRVIEGKAAVADPWYGALPWLFAAPRGGGVERKPVCTLFDGFIRVSHPAAEGVLNEALVDTGRLASVEHLGSGVFGVRVGGYEDACRRVDSRGGTSVERFASFWGERATLRRFKDGTVVESILWRGGVHAVREVVAYAVRRHLGDVEVAVLMGEVEEAAGVTVVDPDAARAGPTFDELATVLRGLDGLPLAIRAVHATSPYLRRCGAFAIRPSGATRFAQPLEIVASFESSAAWPADPVAITAAKAAFYVALKTKLAAQGIAASATISFIDITLAGLVFRLRIRVDREKHVIEDPRDVETLVWTTETLVRHHENIRGLRSPIMGRVTRMVKKWLNAHFLLSQLGPRGDQLVELIVADIFARQDTPVPKSPFRGFCQVLHLLAEFPWEVCPLAVFLKSEEDDGVDDMGTQEDQEVERAEFLVSAQKKFAQKPGHLVVYCDRDDAGEAVTWFDKPYAPEAVIATRVRETARASLAFIEAFAKRSVCSLDTIFQPPTKGFDAVIHLEKRHLPYHPESMQGMLKSRRRTDETLLVGFDPVKRLLDELTARLGKYAMFLMCLNGGSEIFVLLRPIARKHVPFSLRETPYRTPREEKNGVELVLSTDEVVAEIERIGGQLVESVQLLGADAKGSAG